MENLPEAEALFKLADLGMAVDKLLEKCEDSMISAALKSNIRTTSYLIMELSNIGGSNE